MDPEVQARLEALERAAWEAALAQTAGRVELFDAGETLTERRAWELFRDAMREGYGEETWAKIAFNKAEAFAAEAKRRAAK